jgi:sugar phosphate permease
MDSVWIDFANTVAWYATFVLAGAVVVITLMFRLLARDRPWNPGTAPVHQITKEQRRLIARAYGQP